MAKELAEVVTQIHVVEEKNERLGLAIADIESKLRRLGRREVIGEVGLRGEEERDLIRRELQLEEEVGEPSPLEVEEVIKEVLLK